MIIYEITAIFRAGLAESYEKYMCDRHIPDLLATGFFSGARITRSSKNRFRIQYEATDQNALDKYLGTEAARLRADFLAHFPEGIELARENWEVVQIWENK